VEGTNRRDDWGEGGRGVGVRREMNTPGGRKGGKKGKGGRGPQRGEVDTKKNVPDQKGLD